MKFKRYKELKEANYRFASNAFDKERAIFHRDITIDGDIRAVLSAEIRENTSNDFASTIYIYVRADNAEDGGKIPEQRIPILTKNFDTEERAKKYLEKLKGTF